MNNAALGPTVKEYLDNKNQYIIKNNSTVLITVNINQTQ
jgi:hypothetical protein